MTLQRAIRNAAIVAVITAIIATIISYSISRQLMWNGFSSAIIAFVIYLIVFGIVRLIRT